MRKSKLTNHKFLPDILEITESPVSPIGSLLILIIFLLLVVVSIWSYLSKVDVVATCSGTVIPNGNVKVVQPFEEGIITGIYVEDGQYVNKGDILAEFDSGIKETDLETYEQLLESCMLKKEILELLLKDESLTEINGLDDLNSDYRQNIIGYYLSIRNNYSAKLATLQNQLNQNKLLYIEENLKLKKIEKDIEINKAELDKFKIEAFKLNYERSIPEYQKLEILNNRISELIETEKKYKVLYENEIISEQEYKKIKRSREESEEEYILQKKSMELSDKEQQSKDNDIIDNYEKTIATLESELGIQTSQIPISESEISKVEADIKYLKSEEQKELFDNLLEINNQIINYDNELKKIKKSITYVSNMLPFREEFMVYL